MVRLGKMLEKTWLLPIMPIKKVKKRKLNLTALTLNSIKNINKNAEKNELKNINIKINQDYYQQLEKEFPKAKNQKPMTMAEWMGILKKKEQDKVYRERHKKYNKKYGRFYYLKKQLENPEYNKIRYLREKELKLK